MRAIYWTSTSLLALIVLVSAASYFFHKATIDGLRDLGFPAFFRVQLAILKIAAALVLLLPAVPMPAKEWAYAGVALFFLTAIVAHLAHRDPLAISLLPLVFLALLAVSRFTLSRLP